MSVNIDQLLKINKENLVASPNNNTGRSSRAVLSETDLRGRELPKQMSGKGKKKGKKNEDDLDLHSRRQKLERELENLAKESDMLDHHIDEAQKDVEQTIKDLQQKKDSEVEELVQKLMQAEKEGEVIKKSKERKLQKYEKNMSDQKEQILQISQMALSQYIKAAEKEFKQFVKQIEGDVGKYKNKLKDEGVAYELKTKANLIAKEAERLLSNHDRPNMPHSVVSPTKSYLSTVTSKGSKHGLS